MKLIITICLCGIALVVNTHAQLDSNTKIDSNNFSSLYPSALRGEMNAVFDMLKTIEDDALTKKQRETKEAYYHRFLYRTEDFEYNTSDAQIIDLFKRFQNYWRSVIIENVPLALADSLFRDEMKYFLKKNFRPELDIDEIDEHYYRLYQDYLESRNMYGIAMGKTGHLYDLYLWKDQEEISYKIDLPEGQSIDVPIVFMRDFVSNGWSHYTTFGHSYSGGRPTKEKLFCVEEAYGPKDGEEFMISYVSHEGQHFADYKVFPKLKQADLEYRAKLTELVLADSTAYDIIDKFISHSKKDKTYAHPFANYMVIEFLSDAIFGTVYEYDLEKWRTVAVEVINKEALSLLKDHSAKLHSLGADSTEEFITTL